MMSCYYKILGISARASQEEIKKAFRSLALRWHPDRKPQDPDAAERFRQALEAYEALVDPSTRRQYDRDRGYGSKTARTRGNGRSHQSTEGKSASFEEIFQDLFGIRLGVARERRGNDLRFDLQVSRGAAAEGIFEEIDYQRWVFCCKCNGNGRKVASRSCDLCHGDGELEETCSLRVWIPPGSEQGTRLRIQGAGDQPFPGAPPGDLVVLLHIVEGN